MRGLRGFTFRGSIRIWCGGGLSEGAMAGITAFAFALAALANVGGGYLGDIAVRRFGAKNGRRLIGCTSLSCGALILLATAMTADQTASMILISLGLGVTDLMLPSAWAICVDIGGPFTGSVTGAMNTAGQVGGFLCTVLFGYIVAATGSYEIPLLVIAVMLTIAAALFSRIDASRPLVAQVQEGMHAGMEV